MDTFNLQIGGGGTDTKNMKFGVKNIHMNVIANGANITQMHAMKHGVKNILLHVEIDGVNITQLNAKGDLMLKIHIILNFYLMVWKIFL